MRKILTILFLLISLCAFPIVPVQNTYFQKNGIWYFGDSGSSRANRMTKVIGACYCTFHIVCNSTNPYACFHTPFAKDNNFVYYRGVQIRSANPQTWEVIVAVDRSLYSRDDRNVFFRGERVEGADRDSFEDTGVERHSVLGRHSVFGRDKNFIFYGSKLLEGSCSDDFRILEDIYVVSNNRVFFRDREMEIADAESFQILARRGHPWFGVEYTIARDKNHIFIDNQILVAEIDIETFVVVDVNYCAEIDIETFLFVDTNYCFDAICDAIVSDKNGIFHIHRDRETGVFSLVPIEIEKTGSGSVVR